VVNDHLAEQRPQSQYIPSTYSCSAPGCDRLDLQPAVGADDVEHLAEQLGQWGSRERLRHLGQLFLTGQVNRRRRYLVQDHLQALLQVDAQARALPPAAR
jgi:predicted short-subunit dehydrogenase-like oxidoreductase (DUF2520 family)